MVMGKPVSHWKKILRPLLFSTAIRVKKARLGATFNAYDSVMIDT